MKTTSAAEYKNDIKTFFGISEDDTEAIDNAARTQMSDFTHTHFSPKGVFCLETTGEDWFRMTRAEFEKI